MKLDKCLILMSFLLILVIGVGAVSATSDIDVDTSVNNIALSDVSDISNNSAIDNSNNDEISNTTDGEIGTFREFKDLVLVYSHDKYFTLSKDYYIDGCINITAENFYINGNGHTLYGNPNKLTPVFIINNKTGKSVCSISNLNFVNLGSNNMQDGYKNGGVMYISFAATITNCSFFDCYSNGLDQIKDGLIRGSVNRFTIINCSMYNSVDVRPEPYFDNDDKDYEDNNSSDMNKNSSNIINNSNIKNNASMENTGNPLIALLIALITLPILRRK